MDDDNSNEAGRKNARAKKAKKRSDDILEKDSEEDSSDTNAVETPETDATPRSGAEEPQIEDPQKQATEQPEDTGDESREANDESPETEEASETEAGPEPEAEPAGDPTERGEVWLGELFDRMKLDLSAEGRLEGGEFLFNIAGPDADDLVKRSRQSPKLLSAIQTLLSEHLGGDAKGNVLVDIGGFKQKRKSQLTGVADKLGETAKALGKSLTVAGLDRYERRIIHQHLKDVDGVDTESVGDGIFRKLRVLAK